jgi:hypothetical protein
VVIVVAETFEDLVDATGSLGVVDDRMVGLAGAGDRGHDDVEVEVADQPEALDVAVASSTRPRKETSKGWGLLDQHVEAYALLYVGQ